MYVVVFEDLGVRFPFTLFEADVLKYLNMAPSQHQPNSWAFIRGFEILCDRFQHFVGMFFYFYGMKGVEKLSWVYIGAHSNRKQVVLTTETKGKHIRVLWPPSRWMSSKISIAMD